MKKFLNIPFLFLASLMLTVVSCDKLTEEEEGIDSRFVGTWVRDASVSNVVEEVYTLVLNSDASASFSWFRDPKSSSIKDTQHNSSGTWRYDETSNRIITTCKYDAHGQTAIFDVVDVTETTLTVKLEGANKSRTYMKK